MKTLFITYSYLFGNGGGIYAARTHINLFAEVSDEMTLLYPVVEGKDLEGINTHKIMKMVAVEDHRSNVKKYLDLLCGKVHRFQNLPQEYFDSSKYDVVVFDSSVVSSGLIKKFKQVGIKTITIHHNYQIEYLKGDESKIKLLPNLLWTYKYEKEAVVNSDLNITLTSQDVSLLKHHYCKDALFGVLGVYEYQSNTVERVKDKVGGHNYVITGGLGSKQTEDSLISWIQKYWPLLQEIDQTAQLTIAGSNPSPKLSEAIVSAGIKLIPSPKDMRPILEDADFYICPTDCGGGLKLRLLDGLKMGMPVLTHDVSARGYERMIDAGIVYAYRDAESFLSGIRSIQNNKMTRSEVQDRYQSLYRFEEGIKRLNYLLEKLNA